VNFLEAKRILAASKGLIELPLLIGMSGTSDQIDLFIRAHAATRGVALLPKFLPFGTLAQSLLEPPQDNLTELYLLLPWDLARQCDWRVGLGPQTPDAAALLAEAEATLRQLASRPLARFAYLPAPIPPILPRHSDNGGFAASLQRMAAERGAAVLDASFFNLTSYLASGNPVGGAQLTLVAEQLVELALSSGPGTAKVLVTDLDNTLWAGIVGEDGPENVSADPEGKSYRHFLFQAMLRRLKMRGALLAAVSRNDEELARAPFAGGRMPLSEDDFVAIRAGYGSKSEHLAELAGTLDLGLESFVFVDDNPVELAEIRANVPQVICLPFPREEHELPLLFNQLSRLFSRQVLTSEDSERTELYRRRVASSPPPPSEGNELEAFLRGLEMELTIRDCSSGLWSRADQLINKTNQFNLNGVRVSEDEISAILKSGGKLLTARLDDRTGTHGEVIACLIDGAGRVLSFVMSCRVLQRRVEHAFLVWLATHWQGRAITFAFQPTQRNEPFQRFIADPAFHVAGPDRLFDAEAFLDSHRAEAALFTIREEAT
jgi:FkbH-like protein